MPRASSNTTTTIHGRMMRYPILSLLLLPLLLLPPTVLVHGLSTPSPSTASSIQSTVVYGAQSRDLPLLVAKLAARDWGLRTTTICSPGNEEKCQTLMYGGPPSANDNDENRATAISSPDDMEAALQETQSLLLVGYDAPVEASTLTTFLKYTNPEQLKKVVLLSKMGISSGGGMFGGKNEFAASEQALKQVAEERQLDFSIVRAGLLKGGGPGISQGQEIEEGFVEYGLDKSFYNGFLDVVEYKVSVAHDKFSLGADASSIVPGDPHKMPNMLQQMGSKSSFDPCPTDTNRIVVAAAAVAALMEDKTLDVSVGTAAGKALPTTQEWSSLLQQVAV